jgi:FMN phosphatase YigB (HAD superfamily)
MKYKYLKIDYNLYFQPMKEFLIVFDINDTLISKTNKYDRDLLSKFTEEQRNKMYSCNKHLLLKRQYTEVLVDYLNEHKLDYIFWSTSMIHNIKKMIPYLENIGYTFYSGYLSQSDCEEGTITEKIKALKSIKNLKQACKIFDKKLENCVLIDNSYEKHVEGQNFIQIEDIDHFNEDREMIYLVEKIDKFIKCKKDCSVKLLKTKMKSM